MNMIVEMMGIPEFLDSRRKYCTLDPGLATLDSGRWTLDAGLWTLHFGRWTLLLPGSEQNQNPFSHSSWLNY